MLRNIQQDFYDNGDTAASHVTIDLSPFVAAVFRHTRISYSVVLTGLLYLLRFRHACAQKKHQYVKIPFQENGVIILFVTCLLLANKFLHDRHPSNAMWAVNTGLTLSEINKGELYFLTVIQHELKVDKESFQKWMTILFQPKHLAPYQLPIDHHVPSKQSSSSYHGGSRFTEQQQQHFPITERRSENTFMGYAGY